MWLLQWSGLESNTWKPTCFPIYIGKSAANIREETDATVFTSIAGYKILTGIYYFPSFTHSMFPFNSGLTSQVEWTKSLLTRTGAPRLTAQLYCELPQIFTTKHKTSRWVFGIPLIFLPIFVMWHKPYSPGESIRINQPSQYLIQSLPDLLEVWRASNNQDESHSFQFRNCVTNGSIPVLGTKISKLRHPRITEPIHKKCCKY